MFYAVSVKYNKKTYRIKKKRNKFYLDLSSRKIIRISDIEGLNTLSQLQILDLSHNQIKESENLDLLINLEELDLSFNNISQIKGLENLNQLKKLNISYNRVYEIDGLDTLINLEYLNLKTNQVREIKGLENLTQLKTFNLLNNPIFKLYSKKFGGDSSGIFKHPQRVVKYCQKNEKADSFHILNHSRQQTEENDIQKTEIDAIKHKLRDKLLKLYYLLSLSEHVKISDVTKNIDMNREDLLIFLVENRLELGTIDIERNHINVNSVVNSEHFTKIIDNWLKNWLPEPNIDDRNLKLIDSLNKIEEFEEKEIFHNILVFIDKIQIFYHEYKALTEFEKSTLKKIRITPGLSTDDFTAIVKEGYIIKLYLRRQGITSLPDSIGNLKKLQHLDLVGNHLESLPISIGNLTELTDLNLINNNLTVLPESINLLSKLKTLNLFGNNLTELPESIGNLVSLETLGLHGNQLLTLPDSIGNLHQLKSINLRNNKLRLIPDTIGQLNALVELNLEGNELFRIPSSLELLIKRGCRVIK